MARLFDAVQQVRKLPVKPVVVDITNVAAYYAAWPKSDFDVTQDFPNIAPPFDFAWYEWQAPTHWYMNGQHRERPDARELRTGVMVESHDIWQDAGRKAGWISAVPNSGDSDLVMKELAAQARWLLTCVAWVQYRKSAPIFFGVVRLAVRPDGGIAADSAGNCWSIGLTKQAAEHLTTLQLQPKIAAGEVGSGLLYPYFLAVMFMHCKNVERVVNEPPAKVNARRAKEGKEPLERYYTLTIDPMKRILSKEGGIEHNGLKKALHICRGHFATYDEKPLFGKVKGTFWVPQHTRGSDVFGRINKDYKVDPAAKPETIDEKPVGKDTTTQ